MRSFVMFVAAACVQCVSEQTTMAKEKQYLRNNETSSYQPSTDTSTDKVVTN